MSPRQELLAFAAVLAALVAGFFAEVLFLGKRLSPADVLLVSASFRDVRGPLYEPANRLLMDPVLQFQPWLESTRAQIRCGRLPVWNELAGCGAPLLANGQSAVFDPFQAIAYLGTVPGAYGWMAAGRLWVAGLGMFLLSGAFGLGPWGRWFAGLAFPFCGFLVVWLLYPVTNVAIWMPWLFWASDRVLRSPGTKSVAGLGVAIGLVLLGGHIQTSAHVLLAAGSYAAWMAFSGELGPDPRRKLLAWAAGGVLGLALAAVEVIPLGSYLAKSPVWGDRQRERPSFWRVRRPRVLDAACTALPYLYGSQRRGHPHVGRALGVHNLNESAGGYTGLATLVWLAPLGCATARRSHRGRFLVGLTLAGALAAFGVPPVDNLLGVVPVLNVTDNRRLALWIAFGLVLLGGLGLDRLAQGPRRLRGASLWLIAAMALLAASASTRHLEPLLRRKAHEHYARSAAKGPGLSPEVALARASAQVERALTFYPGYLGLAGGELLVLSALAGLWRSGRVAPETLRWALLALVLADLVGFGRGLNPAIAPGDDRVTSPLIAYLRREAPPPYRVVGVGEELPPNVLMRYGLADVRNYDSIELTRSLDWFAPLYDGAGAGADSSARTSRRTVSWKGVLRALDRLEGASVGAVVGSTPPPSGAFARVDRVGDVWVARLDPVPWASLTRSRGTLRTARHAGSIEIISNGSHQDTLIIRETYDPGWHAELDGRSIAVEPDRGTFLRVSVPPGRHRLTLRYAPVEVEAGLVVSGFALAIVVFALTAPRPFRSTRILAEWLGRTRAAELESVLSSSPANH